MCAGAPLWVQESCRVCRSHAVCAEAMPHVQEPCSVWGSHAMLGGAMPCVGEPWRICESHAVCAGAALHVQEPCHVCKKPCRVCRSHAVCAEAVLCVGEPCHVWGSHGTSVGAICVFRSCAARAGAVPCVQEGMPCVQEPHRVCQQRGQSDAHPADAAGQGVQQAGLPCRQLPAAPLLFVFVGTEAKARLTKQVKSRALMPGSLCHHCGRSCVTTGTAPGCFTSKQSSACSSDKT